MSQEKKRADRIGKYLMKNMEQYVFVELMPEYIGKTGLEYLRGVPVPIKKDDLGAFAKDESIKTHQIVASMIDVIGMDPSFRHIPQYVRFLNEIGEKVFTGIIAGSVKLAKENKLDQAAIYMRAALVLEPDSLDSLYNYVLVCRDSYLKLENTAHTEGNEAEYILDYKAEAFAYLELLTTLHPEFSKGFYYLGYAYLNAGQYLKAKLTWEEFLRLEEEGEDFTEIQEWIGKLEHPVKIEEGYSNIHCGKWQEGLDILEKYKETPFMDNWWPLPYYLGVGYNRLGRCQEAVPALKHALKSNSSGAEIIAELIFAYETLGDTQNAEKYLNKLELVRKNLEG